MQLQTVSVMCTCSLKLFFWTGLLVIHRTTALLVLGLYLGLQVFIILLKCDYIIVLE